MWYNKDNERGENMKIIYLVFKTYSSHYLTTDIFCGAFSSLEKTKAYIKKQYNSADFYYEECTLDEER